MKTSLMKIKIGTFSFILKNPKFDKDRMVSDLVDSEFEKRYYKLGLMKAYRPDGTEIPNKAQISEYSDQYQLKGKLFSIAFAGEDVLVHHQFGQNTFEITYDLAEYVEELRVILNNLMTFLSFELKDFELMLLLRGVGSKNPEESLKKWEKKLQNTSDIIFKKSGSDKIEYPGEINNRCTTKSIMVREGEYAVELRFVSEDWSELLKDFKNSENLGIHMISDVENEN